MKPIRLKHAHEAECIAANLNPEEVERISKGLARYFKQAAKLGLMSFGGTGSLTLRHDDGSPLGALIVSCVYEGLVDGGDGSYSPEEDGLLRGER